MISMPIEKFTLIGATTRYGLLTPPMGGVAFVLSSVTGIPVERVFRGAAFYLPAMLLVLLLITYVPAVTLWLILSSLRKVIVVPGRLVNFVVR